MKDDILLLLRSKVKHAQASSSTLYTRWIYMRHGAIKSAIKVWDVHCICILLNSVATVAEQGGQLLLDWLQDVFAFLLVNGSDKLVSIQTFIWG
jgi:hypothetical protein